MPAKIKVVIDRDTCIACGSCAALCPDVFELSEEDGKAQITSKYRAGGSSTGEVTPDLEDCVNSAAEACPVQAITVEK